MVEKLIQADKDLMLYLNGFHTPWLDTIMVLASKTYVWFPLYAILLFLLYKNYGKDTLTIVVSLALAILVADQFTSAIMKPFFARLRPSHEPGLEDLLHYVNNYKGGMYGFVSSHAADTFSAATFCWLLLKDRYKFFFLIFSWPVLVSYSRIYLGVHYPGDVLVGGMLGIFIGWAIYHFYLWINRIAEKQRASST